LVDVVYLHDVLERGTYRIYQRGIRDRFKKWKIWYRRYYGEGGEYVGDVGYVYDSFGKQLEEVRYLVPGKTSKVWKMFCDSFSSNIKNQESVNQVYRVANFIND
jgi:hypothetical protein